MSIDSLEKSLSNLNLNSFQESFHKIFIERIEHFDIMLSIIESKEAFIINLFANEKLYRQLHDNIQNNIYDCKDLVKKITKNRPPTYFDIMNKQKHNKISIFQEFKNLSIECIQSFESIIHHIPYVTETDFTPPEIETFFELLISVNESIYQKEL